MKIPYNILIQIKMSVRPYFKGFTLIFFFYNCRKQDHITKLSGFQYFFEKKTECAMLIQSFYLKQSVLLRGHLEVKKA